jgi:hypothetical protein
MDANKGSLQEIGVRFQLKTKMAVSPCAACGCSYDFCSALYDIFIYEDYSPSAREASGFSPGLRARTPQVS